MILTVYLACMAYIGWPGYAAGNISALYYFGIIAATLAVIIVLHFSLKKRERMRAEREADIHRAAPHNDADADNKQSSE